MGEPIKKSLKLLLYNCTLGNHASTRNKHDRAHVPHTSMPYMSDISFFSLTRHGHLSKNASCLPRLAQIHSSRLRSVSPLSTCCSHAHSSAKVTRLARRRCTKS